MREMGLECLIKILKCLVVWYDELHMGKSGELSTNGTEINDDSLSTTNLTTNPSFGDFNQLLHVKQQKGYIENGIEMFGFFN